VITTQYRVPTTVVDISFERAITGFTYVHSTYMLDDGRSIFLEILKQEATYYSLPNPTS
jgi:hypothetical protein